MKTSFQFCRVVAAIIFGVEVKNDFLSSLACVYPYGGSNLKNNDPGVCQSDLVGISVCWIIEIAN